MSAAPETAVERTCILYGYVKNIKLEPIEAALVNIRLAPTPQNFGNISFSKDIIQLLTDEDGYFEQVFPGGLNLTVVIPVCNFQVSGTLPFSGSIDVNSLNLQF